MLGVKCNGKPFVQIGANTGNDKFYELCIANSPSFVVLVEPCASNKLALEACYNRFKCPVYIEHVAITDNKNIHEINMFSPSPGTAHYSIQPMKNWSNNSVCCVSATTIENIFNKYKITDVGLLFIDTEGNDARIINSINFSKFYIDTIIYEHWPFEQSAFNEYNLLNGIDGMNYIKELLEQHRYFVEPFNFDSSNSNWIAIK